MTDDIKAIRDALAEVNFFKKGGFSYTVNDWNKAANPLRIARLLDALEQAQKDAQRWQYLRDEEGAHSVFSAAYFNTTTADELDAAIDAAMSDAPGA